MQRIYRTRKATIKALVKPLFFVFKGMHSGARFRHVIEMETSKTPLPEFRDILLAGLAVVPASVLDVRPGEVVPHCTSTFGKPDRSQQKAHANATTTAAAAAGGAAATAAGGDAKEEVREDEAKAAAATAVPAAASAVA